MSRRSVYGCSSLTYVFWHLIRVYLRIDVIDDVVENDSTVWTTQGEGRDMKRLFRTFLEYVLIIARQYAAEVLRVGQALCFVT
jgi:hypothetical protein